MDPNQSAQTVAQTVAQAVQAATQQQQQQQQAQQAQQHLSQPSPPVQPLLPTSSIDNLTCQWQGCGERCDSAESLYDHVCERHVGRKSTNNLNLTCQWGSCRTTTVKRDHITSHIRVHVPLKPHKCEFCGKAFKRPQDLKKHVKTHADDSVLAHSPGQQNGRGMGSVNGMGQTKPSSYYNPADLGNPYATYNPGLGGNANNGYGQMAGNGQYAGYGSVSYPNNSAGTDLQSIDTRRRAIEALNDFLGDIKRRAIMPTTYYDVGQRLGGAGGALPLPVGGTGYNTGYNNSGSYNGMSTASLLESFNQGHDVGGGSGGVGTQTYSLSMPNARTKNDLQDIDRFLEQLQHTVYEANNSSAAAAAGIQQPGMHSTFTGDYGFNAGQTHYRNSHSPPNFQSQGSSGATFGQLSASNAPNMGGATTAVDTPALTPASMSSYASSGHSPMSSHSRSSITSANAMYPSLPSVTGMSDLGSGYPTTTSAPASGLASGFDGMDGRRYSGGRLQRQAPDQEQADVEMGEASVDEDGSTTPRPHDAKRPRSKGDSTIDPALREEHSACSSDKASTPAAEDKGQEDWIENIRTIEALRKYITDRLSRGEFEDESTDTFVNIPEEGDAKPGADSNSEEQHSSAANTAEIAKMVEERLAEEKMSDVAAALKPIVEHNANTPDHDVKYPSLPTS